MKANELRTMTESELQKRMTDLRAQLFNLKFQNMIGQLDNPIKIRQIRREIARTLTILNEKKKEAKQ